MATKQKLTIIGLHGWAYDTQKWHHLVKLLSQHQINLKLLNLPGLTSQITKPWDINSYISWLDKKLKPYRQVILLGHSFGGRIAAVYASLYPQKVKKLILIDAAGIKDNSLGRIFKREIFFLLAKFGRLFTNHPVIKKAFYRIIQETDYLKASPIMKQTMKNILSIDLSPYLPQIAAPTLIIWGQKDCITPLKLGHQFHQLIPSSQLKIIKSARHAPQFTHPKKVAQIISRFSL